MGVETPVWVQGLGLVLTLSGWGKVVYDHISSKPKIRGRVFQVMRGCMPHPERQGQKLTTFLTYLYLVNTRKSGVHILDFELQVLNEGKWIRLDRVYGLHNVRELNFDAPDGSPIKIQNFSSNLIYRKVGPVEFGKPLHGWIMFAGSPSLYGVHIERFRVTCIDAYRRRHTLETKAAEFEGLHLLQELAEITIPPSAFMPAQTIDTA